jgi:hypothetical protein
MAAVFEGRVKWVAFRRKLGDDAGHLLQSDPSVGYRLMPPQSPRVRSE